jgi:hypothetical protein
LLKKQKPPTVLDGTPEGSIKTIVFPLLHLPPGIRRFRYGIELLYIV